MQEVEQKVRQLIPSLPASLGFCQLIYELPLNYVDIIMSGFRLGAIDKFLSGVNRQNKGLLIIMLGYICVFGTTQC